MQNELVFPAVDQIIALTKRLNMEMAKAEKWPATGFIPNPKSKLLDQVRQVIRLKHYSIRTEQAYVQ